MTWLIAALALIVVPMVVAQVVMPYLASAMARPFFIHSHHSAVTVAGRIAELSGVNVSISESGYCDCYDPRNNTISLGPITKRCQSVGSVTAAAHEVGHAIQHASGLASPLFKLRVVAVRGIALAIVLMLLCAMVGIFYQPMLWMAGAIYGEAFLLQLLLIAMEWDASCRALTWLVRLRVIHCWRDYVAARGMLRAATLSYALALFSPWHVLFWATGSQASSLTRPTGIPAGLLPPTGWKHVVQVRLEA
jgi:Zn-dependent membrane protease YugP